MVALVLFATLAVHDPAPPPRLNIPPDTSRSVVARQARRESRGQNTERDDSGRSLFLNRESILDRILSAQGDIAGHVAAIDSLLRAHPELKGLVLREMLMPAPLPGFFALPTPSAGEAWRLAGNSTMTAFEKSGLIKTRQMELHDRWTESRIFAPQMDMVATVQWLLEVFK